MLVEIDAEAVPVVPRAQIDADVAPQLQLGHAGRQPVDQLLDLLLGEEVGVIVTAQLPQR